MMDITHLHPELVRCLHSGRVQLPDKRRPPQVFLLHPPGDGVISGHHGIVIQEQASLPSHSLASVINHLRKIGHPSLQPIYR